MEQVSQEIRNYLHCISKIKIGDEIYIYVDSRYIFIRREVINKVKKFNRLCQLATHPFIVVDVYSSLYRGIKFNLPVIKTKLSSAWGCYVEDMVIVKVVCHESK